jgi:rfaE bifunctional protein kinase chain/domain/rfaE bifunctional protein nucleotidyltransferase chain/domain
MKLDVFRKIVPVEQLDALQRGYHERDRCIVYCHGCFDIVHPGHVRYLQFARQQGDVLVVSLTGDDAIEKSDGMRPYVPQELRAENLAALEFVDHVVISSDTTAERIIGSLRPDVYIKGKEYAGSTHPGFLAEKAMVEAQGGRVIFSSGEVVFSSTQIIDRLGGQLAEEGFGQDPRLHTCCARWGLSVASLRRLVQDGFAGKRAMVIGDVLCDRYEFCDTSNVAGEAPILSLRPLESATYPGGAAITAAHLRALGAKVDLVTTTAEDEASEQLIANLDELDIAHTQFACRRSMPVKLRYLVETQKVLKVDHAEAQPIDSAVERQLLAAVEELSQNVDLVILQDFGLGTLSRSVIGRVIEMVRETVAVISGDVSGSRQSLLAMQGIDLLTPTERELRELAGDFEQSLPGVAMSLMKRLELPNLIVSMGRRGSVMFRPRGEAREQWFNARLRSEYLPSLSDRVLDPVGVNEAMLAAASLSLCCGANLPQATYMGAAAGALAAMELGNHPVSGEDLCAWLPYRQELQANRHRNATAL